MIQRLILISLLTLLVSCAQKQWWVGTWTFDRPLTESRNPGKATEKGLSGALVQMLYSTFDGAEFIFSKDRVSVLKNGSGSSESWSIIKRPSYESVTLQIGDKVNSIELQDGRLVASPSGDISDVKLYFNRK